MEEVEGWRTSAAPHARAASSVLTDAGVAAEAALPFKSHAHECMWPGRARLRINCPATCAVHWAQHCAGPWPCTALQLPAYPQRVVSGLCHANFEVAAVQVAGQQASGGTADMHLSGAAGKVLEKEDRAGSEPGSSTPTRGKARHSTAHHSRQADGRAGRRAAGTHAATSHRRFAHPPSPNCAPLQVTDPAAQTVASAKASRMCTHGTTRHESST